MYLRTEQIFINSSILECVCTAVNHAAAINSLNTLNNKHMVSCKKRPQLPDASSVSRPIGLKQNTSSSQYLCATVVVVAVSSVDVYLFAQLFSDLLHFLPGSHGVSTPWCVEENKRHLGHTPETLYLQRKSFSLTELQCLIMRAVQNIKERKIHSTQSNLNPQISPGRADPSKDPLLERQQKRNAPVDELLPPHS